MSTYVLCLSRVGAGPLLIRGGEEYTYRDHGCMVMPACRKRRLSGIQVVTPEKSHIPREGAGEGDSDKKISGKQTEPVSLARFRQTCLGEGKL